nr:reverse transcriptase domain-containing protein [Tanacetum cinerariifolium]
MFGQGRSGPHFSISKVFEGRAKAKWKAGNLNRFLSNSAEKSFPFFKTLKKCIRKSDFQGTAEAETAFKRMKKSITELPMLTTPKEKEELIIYVAATKEAVSAVLEGMEFTYALRFRFDATKNEAEYEALIADLRIAEQMGIKIFKQSIFKEFSIKQVPRGENKKADTVSKITSTSFAHLSKQVLVKELKEKLIDEKDVLTVVEEEGGTWMTPIHVYLVEEILPEVKKKARAIRRKVR